MTIKVLVVDDSAVIRRVLADIINEDSALELLAAVPDPIFAMKRIAQRRPDVIVLDIEMPRMDGITFLRKLMAEDPLPVVICSTLTGSGAETTMEALSAGAVDIIAKPKVAAKSWFLEESKRLQTIIRAAAGANMGSYRAIAKSTPEPKRSASATERIRKPTERLDADVILSAPRGSLKETTEQIVAIGTSTGGTQALEKVLMELDRTCAGIVIVQHMPEKFTAAFAKRLDKLCDITVKEAQDGDRVLTGQALIAPGGKHMVLKCSGAKYFVEVVDGPLVSRHRPSVDVLFRSVAKSAGRNAAGIILTGMGDDGSRGMKEMHDMGAVTYAQDEATCVVYGMPKEALKIGAVDHVIPLDKVAGAIMDFGRSEPAARGVASNLSH